ncbi:MAG: DUF5915 domain-containing protein, partial [Candidatus Pacearchaeota archaeon]
VAPIMPFISEEIYRNLTGDESVHLTNWPEINESLINSKLEKEMGVVRKIVELGHAKRKEAGIKVRQPLSHLKIKNLEFEINDELIDLIKDEINVKNVLQATGKGELNIELDTKITDELKKEGEAREIVRKIQEERKKIGTRLNEKINLIIDRWPVEFEEYIKKNALVDQIKKGDSFSIIRK